jgi:hypothetical protein
MSLVDDAKLNDGCVGVESKTTCCHCVHVCAWHQVGEDLWGGPH